MKNLFTFITIIALIVSSLSLSLRTKRKTRCNMITYSVQSGDGLYSIAQKYGDDANEIAKRNNIANPNLIYGGQQLQVCQLQIYHCSMDSCDWINADEF